jgi:hypothetical protein
LNGAGSISHSQNGNKTMRTKLAVSVEYKSGNSFIYTLLVGVAIYFLVRWVAPLLLAACMVGAVL